MVNHQSPYGQIIRIPSELYYGDMTEDDLNAIEQKYANSNAVIINFSGHFEPDDADITDVLPDHIDFPFYEE